MVQKLNSVQQQFFIINQMFPDSPAYNIALLYHISGSLKVPHLIDAINRVAAKNPILNSRVQQRAGQLLFVPHQDRVSFTQEEDILPSRREDLIRDWVNSPFSLEKEALSRFYLIKESQESYFFLIVQHHIITDLQSKRILIEEIENAFNQGICQGHPLSEPTVKKIKTEYWETNIAPHILQLPGGVPSRGPFKGEGSNCYWKGPQRVVELLQSQEERGKSFVFLNLLTGYSLFLNRLTGQGEFNMAIPLSNRKGEAELRELGAFVNALPLQVKINHGDDFAAVYQKLRKQMLLLHRVEGDSFLQVSPLYKGPRDSRYSSIMQAGFTQEPLIPFHLEGLSTQPLPFYPDGAQMDLFFTYWPEGDSLAGRWEYNQAAFTEEQIKKWQESFNYFLEQIFLEEANWNSIPLVPPGDWSILFGDTQTPLSPYPLEKTLSQQLLESYEAFGNNKALSYGSQSYTYKEFASRTLACAQWLMENGVTSKHISVALPRSAELLMVVHAIIISGNIYVPVDPRWPDERINFILEDSHSALIVEEEPRERLKDCRSISFQDMKSQSSWSGMDKLPNCDDPLYLLYTSGTTGNPKGALISHRGLTNRIYWMQELIPIGDGDTLLQKTPTTFDVSIWELFWSFLFGARLHVAQPGGHLDPEYLLKTLQEEGISYVHFVPSLLRDYLKEARRFPETLKGVICSGETLSKSLYQQYLESTEADLYNFYGPTEASIDITAWKCQRDDLNYDSIPIGRAVPHSGVLILDKGDQLCPPYVQGEICLTGVQLAKGYWRRDSLNKEAFQTIPFEGKSIRLYRTGDRGRYRSDGVIEYLGRGDSQIKIKGVRIEIQEIESIINKQPFVYQGVVKLFSSGEDHSRLIAFVRYTTPQEESKRLREVLKAILPGYMIPHAFQHVENFPLLTSGKIDRKALVWSGPNKDILPLKEDSDYIRFLQKLWGRLLEISPVGIDTSFFDLGGHSLLLREMKREIHDQIGINVEILELFNHPTIIDLASFLEKKKQGAFESRDIGSPSRSRQNMARLKPRHKR